VLTVRTQPELSSQTNSPGNPFDATLTGPCAVHGKTVAPAGSSVRGTVPEAHKAGRLKGGTSLNIKLTSVTIKGQTYRLSTTSMNQTSKGKGKRTAAMVAGGGGAGCPDRQSGGGGKGAAIGASVGAGAGTAGAGLTGNRNISLPAESAVSFKMTNSLTLNPSAAAIADDSQSPT